MNFRIYCDSGSERLRGHTEMSDDKSAKAGMPSALALEPWLRGTLTEVGAVPRGVLHALELAGEDLRKWCGTLTDEEVNARPMGLPPIVFHLRHIARSLDRLLTYAEGRGLTVEQLAALKTELDPGATREGLFAELTTALRKSAERVRNLGAEDLEQTRAVGKKALSTSVGGLLVHVADHTQRHVGQAVTTAKVIVAQRG
jgi:uncharacterized damage-inducible protein DinB